MCFGVTLPGEENLLLIMIESWWRNDQFPELENDDALFAYMIRASEEFGKMRWDELNDPVLRCLLWMGIYNWRNDGTRLHQATQAICHGTAIGTRILGRVLEVERKVPIQCCFAFVQNSLNWI